LRVTKKEDLHDPVDLLLELGRERGAPLAVLALQFKNNHFTEMWCGTEAGSNSRLIDFCIKAHRLLYQSSYLRLIDF